MLCLFLDQNKDYRPEDGFPASHAKRAIGLNLINFIYLFYNLSEFLLFRSWLKQERVSVFLNRDGGCTSTDSDTMGLCGWRDMRTLGHNCKYEDSVWLRCFNETGNSGKRL
jgi:hypothetical protein